MPDLNINLKFLGEFLQAHKDGYFYKHPIPMQLVLDGEGKETYDENNIVITEPQFTPMEWFKICIIDHVINDSDSGNANIAKKLNVKLPRNSIQ